LEIIFDLLFGFPTNNIISLRGAGASACNALWSMAISTRKEGLKPAKVKAMAQHTLQNTTRGGAGCRTYTGSTFIRVLHVEMKELTHACGFNGRM